MAQEASGEEVNKEQKRNEVISLINKSQGPDHHSRNELLLRNGRWGTCVDCPKRDGNIFPEECINTTRYDHNIEVFPETEKLLAEYNAK